MEIQLRKLSNNKYENNTISNGYDNSLSDNNTNQISNQYDNSSLSNYHSNDTSNQYENTSLSQQYDNSVLSNYNTDETNNRNDSKDQYSYNTTNNTDGSVVSTTTQSLPVQFNMQVEIVIQGNADNAAINEIKSALSQIEGTLATKVRQILEDVFRAEIEGAEG